MRSDGTNWRNSVSPLTWREPEVVYCDGCGKEAEGAVSFGHFNEPTRTLPAGWRASGYLLACSKACQEKLDERERSQ
jgi:hypothetical protein